MIRKIVNIDEEKCNGCGICAQACHEGAIDIIDGKARLIGDEYCDGLGDCLPECPTGAISIIQRESKPYDEQSVEDKRGEHGESTKEQVEGIKSELMQWPVQISLINPKAPYLKGADLLIAADCTAYAYGDFHRKFIKDRITLIGCPKLDDNEYYKEKLTEILSKNDVNSITVARMEVPCCGGIINAVRFAMLQSGTIVPYQEIVINNQGEIIS